MIGRMMVIELTDERTLPEMCTLCTEDAWYFDNTVESCQSHVGLLELEYHELY